MCEVIWPGMHLTKVSGLTIHLWLQQLPNKSCLSVLNDRVQLYLKSSNQELGEEQNNRRCFVNENLQCDIRWWEKLCINTYLSTSGLWGTTIHLIWTSEVARCAKCLETCWETDCYTKLTEPFTRLTIDENVINNALHSVSGRAIEKLKGSLQSSFHHRDVFCFPFIG